MATITGNNSDNNLIGTNKNDLILGLGGDDTLSGGNGNDLLFGGSGKDQILGGDGNDIVDGGSSDDSIDGSSGNDLLLGGSGNDFVDGGSGIDLLLGGDGNDSLTGGLGADLLNGGSGQDRFIYLLATDSPTAAGWDRILDFTQDQDKIDLAAFRNVSPDLDLIWKGEDPAVAGPWGVWYHNGATSTFVYADTSGDGIADLKIELKNTPELNLVVTDFIGVVGAQVNDAPVAVADTLAATEDTPVTYTAAQLLGNDDDGDPELVQTLTIASVTSGTGGAAVLNVDGTVTFTPDANFNGAANFTYTVSDGLATSTAATVAVNVAAVNDAPTVAGLVVTEPSISFVASDADNATLSLASPFANAFGDPTITSGATTILTPTQQAPAVSGTLQVTDGAATADVVGLYLGTSGNDTAIAPLAGSPNAMYGFAGADSLTGGTGADSLFGGDGNDTIKGGAGSDSLAGGLGIDTLSYEDSPTRVIVNMLATGIVVVGADTVLAGTARDGFGTTDTLSGFETVIGSAFNDFLQGSTNVANRLEGRDGNDTLVGSGISDNIAGAADDTLLGGAGDDMLRQTRGHDYLDGGVGFNDRVEFTNPNGTSASGIAYGGAVGVNVNLGTGISDADPSGSDLQNGPGGNTATILGIEQVFGTVGNDVLIGGSLARTSGGGFTEAFRGNAGNDTIDGQGADTAQGAFDIDRVEYVNSPGPVIVNLGPTPIMVGTEVVAGGTARDGFGTTDTLSHVNHVQGSNFNDTLIGGNPEYDHTFERFEGRGGDDFMDGGSGIDEVSYQNAPGAVTVNLGLGTASGADGNDTFINMEGVRGSQSGDMLIGSDSLNVVEHFIGDGGNDFIDGGAGIDFASWQGAPLTAGGLTAFLANGFGNVFHFATGTDTLVNIEGLIGTNSGDTLGGGIGDQWFRGRGGSDVLDGGVGSDTADYSVDPGAVTVNLAMGTATDGWGGIWELQGNDTLTNIENVRGSQFDDSITGDFNANVLDGGTGNDTIRGGAGNDMLSGGADIDTLDYADSPSRVIVNMFVTSSVTVGGITVLPGSAFDGYGTFDTVSGFENVIGTPFNDFLQGSTNVANRLEGGSGNDTLVGSGVSDGIDPPVLGAANDTLLGGAGDDVLRQSRGNDVIHGGDGFDRLEFINNGIAYGGPLGIGVSVNLATGRSDADPNNGDAVNPAGGDVATVSSIEFVVGTFGNDVFTGGDALHASVFETGQTEFFQPLGGNDTITGEAGRGWSTAVDYSSNTSAQAVSVTLGNSNNIGTASDGFGGTDTLNDVEVVRGGAGNDLLVGGSYSQGATGVFVETFRGNAGNDTIDGGGSDTVIGAHGVTDRADYNNSPFAVVVNLGATPISGNFYGTGVITVSGGTALDGFDSDSLTVGVQPYTDTLIDINTVRGSSFNDTLIGGSPALDSNDRFEGLAGNDSIDGGGGNDEADYSTSPFAVVVNLGTSPISGNFYGAGVITVNGGTARDGFSSTGGGTDTLVSMERARGGDFNDTLVGGANALERLMGGPGNDFIDGGSMTGVNYAAFLLAGSAANASISNGSGTAVNDGQGGTDTLVNINGLWGTNFSDTLTGGLGDQWFRGSGGSDSIDGGADTDTASYASDPNGVIVNLSGAPVVVGSETVAGGTARDGWGGIWGLQGTDTLVNIENVDGSDFNDTLIGNDGDNVMSGRGGSDSIDGGAGNDSIDGGAGDDKMDGGSGADLLDLSGGTAGVVFILTNDIVDTTVNLSSIGLSTAAGDTYRNLEGVIGTNFNDTLFGSANDDVLTGGGGTDIMTGNAGGDTFDFNATSESSTTLALSDVINGFLHGVDKIDLSTIDADTGVGGDQAFLFGGNNASTVANSVTWFESGGGNTILQIDNTGNTTADMQIVLAGTGLGLTDADFIL